ncbi:MAG: preprotein translocase subunit YajC [Acidobacteria bacterium]|jgi:preprotein translocase subunit YajC|nr:preprotein translocase subunit YajC [Acidobacteriota bacterium]
MTQFPQLVTGTGAPLALLAQQPAAPGAGAFLIQLAPILLVFVIFYFLLIRPARQRQKAHEEMLKQIQPGETIVTSGGLVGKVIRAEESKLKVRIAPTVEVTVLRSHIAGKSDEETL